jgi:hypothetical protein
VYTHPYPKPVFHNEKEFIENPVPLSKSGEGLGVGFYGNQQAISRSNYFFEIHAQKDYITTNCCIT